ncbi:MAG TPA: NUDIX domain-containing protein [Anaerolineales bacterium]|nr:NUDIX domain-containing protein [Anaerolineales bacterium]
MPAIGVTAVIVDDDQRVLLHRRRDFFVWALPGGRIEPGEPTESAAAREVREETGYEIAMTRFVGEYWRPQTFDGSQLVYLGRVTGGKPIQQGLETRAVRWFPLHALPWSLPTAHRLIIRDATADARTPVKKTIRISPLEAGLIRLARWLRR